jgi:hypothetical protein
VAHLDLGHVGVLWLPTMATGDTDDVEIWTLVELAGNP